jgi:hypothetical protein
MAAPAAHRTIRGTSKEEAMRFSRAILGLAVLPVLWQSSTANAMTASEHAVSGTDRPPVNRWYFNAVPDQTYGAEAYAYAKDAKPWQDDDDGMTLSVGPANVCAGDGGHADIAIRMLGVGTCTLVATAPPSEDGDRSSSVEHSFEVKPAPLMITADNVNKASDDPSPPFTATYTGLRNGDTPAAITGVVFSGPAAASPPGRYQIRVMGGTSPNYAISFGTGMLTIRPVLRFRAQGLPDGVSNVLRVDGVNYRTPTRLVVDQGSTHKIQWMPVVVSDHELFITAPPTYSEKVVRDVTETALYFTVPGMLRLIGLTPQDSMLFAVWDQVKFQLGTSAALKALHDYADLVNDDPALDGDDAGWIVTHLQVVYNLYNGHGMV